jgi:hypothetical protein
VEFIHNMQVQTHVFCVSMLIWIAMDFVILNWKKIKKNDKKSIITSFQFPCVEFIPWVPRGHFKRWAKLNYCYIFHTLLCLGLPSSFKFTNYTMSWSNEIIIWFTFVAFRVSKYSFYMSNFQAPITFGYNSHLSNFIPSTFILT